MEEAVVFIDEGFLSKLSKSFGDGKYLKFAQNLAEKQNLLCKKIFYYHAPPFQSNPSTKEEDERKQKYDKFINKLKKNPIIKVEEGRVQKTVNSEGKIKYMQKGVDALLSVGLSFIPLDFPNIKKIILIASDTDFCPVINKLKEKGVSVILYSYYERKRDTNFSQSYHLISCCSKYIKLTKQDLDNCKLEK